MIRLEGFSIEKRPKEFNHDGTVRTYQWAVLVTAGCVGHCDTEAEAETLIGTIRLKVAVHNNTRGRNA